MLIAALIPISAAVGLAVALLRSTIQFSRSAAPYYIVKRGEIERETRPLSDAVVHVCGDTRLLSGLSSSETKGRTAFCAGALLSVAGLRFGERTQRWSTINLMFTCALVYRRDGSSSSCFAWRTESTTTGTRHLSSLA